MMAQIETKTPEPQPRHTAGRGHMVCSDCVVSISVNCYDMPTVTVYSYLSVKVQRRTITYDCPRS